VKKNVKVHLKNDPEILMKFSVLKQNLTNKTMWLKLKIAKFMTAQEHKTGIWKILFWP